MAQYTLRDEMVSHTIDADSLAEARELAREWALEGDCDTSRGTVYCDVRIFDEDGDYVEKVTVTFEQEEPACTEDEHDWQSPYEILGGLKENPGVWGHGAGIIMREVCMHCGCEKKTDTWAQRRDTGEQGLTEVTYEAKKYADEVAELAAAE